MSVLFSTLHPLIRTASTTSTRSISITAVNFKKSKLGKITTKPKQQRARDMTQSIAEGLAAIDQLALKAQRVKELERIGTSTGTATTSQDSDTTTQESLFEADPSPIQNDSTPALQFDPQEASFHERPTPSSSSQQRSGKDKSYAPEETIYTANPSFSAPLVLAATFVAAVFALNGADMARTMWSETNDSGETKLAPAWKRYLIASGFATVGLGITVWGCTAPARIVTKLTIRRPIMSPPTSIHFPSDALISIHTPITKLPFLSPKETPLSSILLFGPLSDVQQSYHPRDSPAEPVRPKGPIGRLLAPLSELLIAPVSRRPKKSHWEKAKMEGIPLPSHVPILIKGDRASYSMAVKRGTAGMGDTQGAWCEDWEGLERALLGVRERS